MMRLAKPSPFGVAACRALPRLLVRGVLALGLLGLLAACSFTPRSLLGTNPPLERREADQMVGVWTCLRLENNHQHASPQAIHIRADGTGELLISYVNKNGRYWVVGADFRLEGGPDGWVAHVVSPTSVLAQNIHSDVMAGYFRPGERLRLVSTRHGLVLDRVSDNAVFYTRESAEPAPSVAGRLVEQTRAVLFAKGHTGAEQSRDGQLHAMTAAFQLGMGAGAMGQGNQAAAVAGFSAAQRSATAGLRGEAYDAEAATRDALATGHAIGSGGAAATLPDFGAARPPSGGPGDVTPGLVELTTADMAAYPDGHAYNIQTIAPKGSSAGEFIVMYGLPLQNARSLLATGYALAADRSIHGPGNPRRTISWERVPVRAGDRIKMGAEWQDGRMPPPRFGMLYHIRQTVP